MGPRLFRRGNVNCLAGSISIYRLQWGHVSSDVETCIIGCIVNIPLHASMGPRLFRRGNKV